MRLYTTEQLRELSTAVGPQWQGEVRAALRYCADLIDAANAVIAQPVKPWVGLTDAERDDLTYGIFYYLDIPDNFMDAFEAKLKEKNT